MRVLVLFAHPGLNHSKINLALANTAKQVKDITFVDLYAEYPRLIRLNWKPIPSDIENY